MSSNPRIMVTGAGGFVGRSLVARIREALPEAALLPLGRAASTDANYRSVDVCSDALDVVVEEFRPSHIVHLAAMSSVAAALTQATATADVAILGAMKLSDAVRRHVPDATVLFASSGEVYGAAFRQGMLDETSPVAPANPYARSKLASEFILMDRLGSDSRLIIMRPLNHTGAGQDVRFVVPAFARQIAEIESGAREPVIRVGNLEARRDFLAVEDVVDAYMTALMPGAAPMDAGIYNVTSQNLRSIGSVLDDLCAMSTAACSVAIDPEKLRPVDVPETRLRSEKLREATGWAPRKAWQDILREVLDAARAQVASEAA